MRRALIIGPRGLRGAYEAGVAATLCRRLPSGYFDAIYSCSSGAFTATYFAANQPDHIEYVWRNLIDGTQFVSLLNPFRGREIMNIEYLIDIYKGDKAHLDIDALFAPGIKLYFTLTNVDEGKVEYVNPNRKNIFDVLRATAAIPGLYKPVILDGKAYFDGGILDPLPVEKVLEDSYDEITVVANARYGAWDDISRWLMLLINTKVGKMIRKGSELQHELDGILLDEKIHLIKPSAQIQMRNSFDRDHDKINKTFDIGVQDGLKYLDSVLDY